MLPSQHVSLFSKEPIRSWAFCHPEMIYKYIIMSCARVCWHVTCVPDCVQSCVRVCTCECACVTVHICADMFSPTLDHCVGNLFSWQMSLLTKVPAGKLVGGNYWLANLGMQIAGGKCHRTTQIGALIKHVLLQITWKEY